MLLSRAAMRASADATHARLGGPGQWLLALPPTYVAGLQVLFRSVRAGTEPVVRTVASEAAARPARGATSPWCRPSWSGCSTSRRAEALAASTPCSSAARALEPRLREQAETAGVPVVTTYGMSETCGGCVYDGRPLDGVGCGRRRRAGAARAGRCSSTGTTGDPSGPPRCCRTAGSSPPTSAGSTTTARLKVLGRVDDVVVSGGVNVPAARGRAELREHPGVRDAEVVGVPDDEWGERRGRRRGRRPDLGLDELRELGRRASSPAPGRRGASYAWTRLPLLANGKVDRLAVESWRDRARWHVHVFSIPMRTRFRGITVREGMLLRGDGGLGRVQPVPGVRRRDRRALAARRPSRPPTRAGRTPVRERVPVNVTVPAVGPEQAAAIVREAAAAAPPRSRSPSPARRSPTSEARLEAVRDALGPDGRIRIDANGGWSVDEAVAAHPGAGPGGRRPGVRRAAVRRPSRTWPLVRRRVDVPVAADESIRRADDPYRVRDLEAADVAVLKVQPLGGVRACLRIAEDIGLPVVVSSALETSVGIAAGVALAAALPELPYACGLATVQLLADDVVVEPLLPRRRRAAGRTPGGRRRRARRTAPRRTGSVTGEERLAAIGSTS